VAMVALGLLNFGVAPTIALGTDMMISSAPPEKAGAVSAISETTHEVGLGAGIAVLGSIGTTVYRGQTSEELPKGLPDDSVSAFLDTIGSAVEEAGQLPDRVGAAALDVANAAFTRGMLVVSVICLTVTVLALSMLSVLLRRTPVNDTEVPDADSATDAQSLQK
jgi:DHA2 family multidrug resistance protein-like MFS transporter